MSEHLHCWHDAGIVLTSYPEQYQLICCHCGEARNITEEKMYSLRFEHFTPPDKENHGTYVEKLNLLNEWKFTHMSEEIKQEKPAIERLTEWLKENNLTLGVAVLTPEGERISPKNFVPAGWTTVPTITEVKPDDANGQS